MRTAAIDLAGNLWVAFVTPITYVFDGDGEKVRTVQFRAAGIIQPTSLFFADRNRILVTPAATSSRRADATSSGFSRK